MSEYNKMLLGNEYKSSDIKLKEHRDNISKLILLFNNESSPEKRNDILKKIINFTIEEIHIHPPFICEYGYNIKFGKNIFINFGCIILDAAVVEIGNNVLFGPNVSLYTSTHPIDANKRKEGIDIAYPITIEDNVWIGGNSVINPGIHIGENSVIGSGSVVTKNIPCNVVAAGNPCRIIRYLKENDSYGKYD